MARESLDLIETMYEIAKAAQPITGRGIGYKLFTRGMIPSMATREMQRVYRLLKEARERGFIPWGWIVDETRSVERTPCGMIPRSSSGLSQFVSARLLEPAAAAARGVVREGHHARCP